MIDKTNSEHIGLTTNQALTQLHKDIEQVLLHYCVSQESRKRKSWLKDALHHKSQHTLLSWISITAILTSALWLTISYFIYADNTSVIYESIVLVILLALNIFLAIHDSKLRHTEIPLRVHILLDKIKRATADRKWSCDNYPHLNSPFSPCITLQWTHRDGKLVNLPWALLVKDDIVMIRPGQVSPGYCEALDRNDEYPLLHPKEVYGPSLSNANESISIPKLRKPLECKLYKLIETPYLCNLKMALEQALDKPSTHINQQRYLVVVKCIEQIAFPVFLLLILIVNCIRYFYFTNIFGAGDWVEMFVLIPISVTLPLLPVIFPVVWISLNCFGNARLRALFDYSYQISRDFYGVFEDADRISLSHLILHYSWKDVWRNFLAIFFGTGHIMSRSANILHVLGSVTALCCVDKKGILSWPNPTAEKVFFLHDIEDPSSSSSLENVGDINTDTESLDYRTTAATVINNKFDSTHKTVAEVLDLTHNQKDPFKLHFDDQEWNKHINSLKPLGLAILLNTCNLETQEHYSQFCSHITCEAMYNENLIPVTNRRCLCELAMQIGFSEQAQKIFKLEQQLSTFRHLQPETMRRDNKFARSLQLSTKLKFPFPHMVAVVIKELSSGSHQLLSQGTADIILDSCVDYWDGHDLCTLTASDRKKIQDFYQRSSLTAYCTAFAYRPLSQNISDKCSQIYLELPSDSKQLYRNRRSPTPIHWDCKTVLEPKLKTPIGQFYSTDSLLFNDNSHSETTSTNNCFELQCNQVFIGMVTMQYQAQADMVHLIELLERACIRFVHFSKENELRSRVFSEKMGLESGWNCHISLLSERTRRESGPSECWANNGTVRVSSPTSLPTHKRPQTSPMVAVNSTFSADNRRVFDSNLETTRAISFSAPSAINLEHSVVKFDPDVEQPSCDSGEGCDLGVSEESVLIQETELCSSPQEHWQSLSCLTDSTEQSAPVNFDMSNRAKLPRGIDKIRPHIEQIDNVPLLVSLFTDCTPSVIREMLHIMQDFGEVVCVMCSSANSENMGICMQADASIAVEPLYPQVCQNVPAFKNCESYPSPIELSRALNSLTCPLAMKREDPISLYHLIMLARHFLVSLWSTIQFWLGCCISVTMIQFISALLMLPPILNTGHVLWLICFIIPSLSLSLMGSPVDSDIMKKPIGKNQCTLNTEILIFISWCYGAKFLPMIFIVILTYAATLSSFCIDICDVENCSCSLFLLPDLPQNETLWGGWSQYDYSLLTSQHFTLLVIVLNLLILSVGFVNREDSIWSKGPQNNVLWIFVSCTLVILQLFYTYLTLLANYTDDQLNFGNISCFVLFFAICSPLLTFAITELVKWKEIKINLRCQRRARLDFGTKLGMNSPF